ncbi:MAG: nuclear transport factor 2 family protein [Alphaproteobacteria bacterium]|nr:nuclear transport factor 2 family protein [Alphaproteobacteria bacterium]
MAAKKPAKTKKPSAKTAPKKKTEAPAKKKPLASHKILKQMPRPSLMAQLVGGAGSAPKLPLRLQAAVDKSEIADLLARAARGIDRMDETLLRSVFLPDATVDLGPGLFQGTSNDYVQWALGVFQQVRSSHHLIANIQAQLDGDVALVESYCHAYHRLDKPTGREDLFIGSRFLDRLERRPSGPSGVWKIMHRKQVIDWVRTEAASDIFYHQNPDALWSYRTKTDPSYQMQQFPGSQTSGKLPSFLGRRYESKSLKF